MQLRVKANYVVVGGDWNTDLSRLQSTHANAFNFCTEYNLTCISSVYSIGFTYESDANEARSTNCHFVNSDSLINCVKNILLLMMSIICLIIFHYVCILIF